MNDSAKPVAYLAALKEMQKSPTTWLITGVAGFIGSNLLETLLQAQQNVVGIDNFATGRQSNLDDVRSQVGEENWGKFRMVEGDITDPSTCASACQGVSYILHQAALGSVPRSLKTPLDTHKANVTGFITMLEAARNAGIKRFVYASSSSVYGDHEELPKVEDRLGLVLSPYAATKLIDEIIAGTWGRCYGMECIGLRYFNVFGRRQDPDGAYAAVVPKWISQILKNAPCSINGDGETSRDFCYITNVCQINILAATCHNDNALNKVYNVAFGERMTLNELHTALRNFLPGLTPEQRNMSAVYEAFRPGDIRHSLADITKAKELLGYNPSHSCIEGLKEALAWYYDEHIKS